MRNEPGPAHSQSYYLGNCTRSKGLWPSSRISRIPTRSEVETKDFFQLFQLVQSVQHGECSLEDHPGDRIE